VYEGDMKEIEVSPSQRGERYQNFIIQKKFKILYLGIKFINSIFFLVQKIRESSKILYSHHIKKCGSPMSVIFTHFTNIKKMQSFFLK